MLSDQQVEFFVFQFRQQIEALQALQTNQNALINALQSQVTTLSNAATATPQIPVATAADSYLVAGGIVHKLLHTFEKAVIFVKDVAIQGVLTLTHALAVTQGGTGATTAAGARANLSAAALPQTIAGSNFTYPGQASTPCAGSQAFTINGSNFIAPLGGGACSGSQTVTINGNSFTFTVGAAANTGTQPLV